MSGACSVRGTLVTLHGLVSASQYNGQLGRVIVSKDATGRALVRLTTGGQQLSIKEENLRPAVTVPDTASSAFIIKYGTFTSPDELATLIVPFELTSLGTGLDNELAEMSQKLGWKQAANVAKFYDHEGSFWSYFSAYGPTVGEKTTKLRAGTYSLQSLVAPRFRIKGDVVVVVDGPEPITANIVMSRYSLVESLWYYTAHNHKEVFGIREMTRFGKKEGMDVTGFKAVHIDDVPAVKRSGYAGPVFTWSTMPKIV